MLIQTQNFKNLSPLGGRDNPRPPEKPERQPDQFQSAEFHGDSSGPKWLLAAFAAVGVLGTAGAASAAQAQVVVTQDPQVAQDAMQELEEASAKQGIAIEFLLPSPIPGQGRRIANEDAARLLSQGKRLLVQEVTREDGPVRGPELEVKLVRRQAYLTGQDDLQSYVRYFSGAEAQNSTEAAAQKLKKFVYGKQELTLLTRPGADTEHPTLSPFAAARELAEEQPVSVKTVADGVTRLEDQEQTLHSLADVDTLVQPVLPEGCGLYVDFQSSADGTIQLVEKPNCPME